MTRPLVALDRSGSVAGVRLNRPERHNALVPELLDELLEVLDLVAGDASIRAVVLAANGPSFSTGGDIRRFAEAADRAAYADVLVGGLNRAIISLIELPQPVVAAVHGIVTGGSLGLILSADVVLVAPEASFTPWYAAVGFSPDGGWTAMLPGVIGRHRAAMALMGNRTITARDAVDWGLAAELVSGDVREAAREVALSISAGGASGGAAKRLLHGDTAALRRRLDAERRRFVAQVATAEADRGIAAYLAGRA